MKIFLTKTMSGLTMLALLLPAAASAATAEELAAQIEALLRQVSALQEQVTAGPTPSGSTQTTQSTYTNTSNATPTTSTASGGQCPLISRNLKKGMSGADVTRLQQFLALDTAIYPEAQATGYYGALTEAAIKRFQCKNKIVCEGTPESTGYGVTGPRTAALLALQCSSGGGAPASTVSGFMRVTPISGQAPLNVTIEAILNTAKSCGSYTYEVHYGDSAAPTTLTVPANTCNEVRQVLNHTYSSAGTYTIAFRSGVHQNTALVTVTAPTTNTTNTNTSGGSISLSASPLSGQAPLSVVFNGTRNINNVCSMGDYTIQFGDGQTTTLSDSGCSAATFSIGHTYTAGGTFTARLYRNASQGDAQTVSITAQASASAGAAGAAGASSSSGGQFTVTVGDGGDAKRALAKFSRTSSCARYDIDWGDGTAHATQAEGSCSPATVTTEISHTYVTSGSYTITLKRGASLQNTDTIGLVIVQ